MNWFLKKGLWEEGSLGWDRVGAEKEKDWRFEFCKACYEYCKKQCQTSAMLSMRVLKRAFRRGW